MRSLKTFFALCATIALCILTLCLAGTPASAQLKVLGSFNNTNGADPYAGLVSDVAGNLYGTTCCGGAHNYGTVFELSPKAGGGWSEKILHSFNDNGKDGYAPGGNLIFDSAGNLYGTASGGTGLCKESNYVIGCGMVFELMPQSDGSWKEKVLHNFFNKGEEGMDPSGGLVFDSAGNLYGGTTYSGVPDGGGTIYELSPTAGGDWTFAVIYYFATGNPQGNLILDSHGNLYGTAGYAGTYLYGMAYELSPSAGGTWTETVLHSFDQNQDGTDGACPCSSLIFDSAGNLYGTTVRGGVYNEGDGTVFELSPAAGGSWTETIIHNFDCHSDGCAPTASLVFDAAGNLHGTTTNGGAGSCPYGNGCGTVFELSPQSGGTWAEPALHSFGAGAYGAIPFSNLILDSAGNLYGTTSKGGSSKDGTVFEITP
jgi:uncharacterized repeat protein (TIGR03803 family)